MPIHDVGYRKWTGIKTSALWRWWIITKSGVRLAFKSNWVKRMLFAAWLPLLYWGGVFLFIENAMLQDEQRNGSFEVQQQELLNIISADNPEQAAKEAAQAELEELKAQMAQGFVAEQLEESLGNLPQMNQVLEAIKSGDSNLMRQRIWRYLLMSYFRYPQALMLIFLLGAVAPALISQDIQSRAFLVYFSKPIGCWEYIIGKFMIPASFLVAITTLPALVLYCIAVFASPSFSVILSTWDIPIRILLATVVVVGPTCLIALMLSSLTQESRFASFAWFAVWVLGHGAYLAALASTAAQQQETDFGALQNSLAVKNWSVLSLYNCLGDAQLYLFGFASFAESWRGILVLSVISIVALIILHRRVSAPTRI